MNLSVYWNDVLTVCRFLNYKMLEGNVVLEVNFDTPPAAHVIIFWTFYFYCVMFFDVVLCVLVIVVVDCF